MNRSCRIVSNNFPLSIDKLIFTKKKKKEIFRYLSCAPDDLSMFYRVFVVFLLLPSPPSENR